MTIVRISGIIVSSEYHWFREDIAAGVITTPVETAYAIASAHDDLEIVLNSYGGDVFAANTISNTIARWAVEHPEHNLTFTVDAIALSAAAMILAKAPENALRRVHADSLVMFHSAAGYACGGPGAMKDAAAVMDKINDSIRAVLARRTDIPAETVNEWLSEGRMGWLTGEEACRHGLADSLIIAPVGDMPRPLTADEEAVLASQPQIAASYRSIADLLNTHIKELNMKIHNEDNDKEKDKDEQEPQNPPADQDEDKDEKPEEKPDEKPEEKPEGEEGGDPEKEKDKEKDKEIEDLKNQVKDLQARCEKAEASLSRLTAGLRNGTQPDAPQQTFSEMLRGLPANLTQNEWDDRFLALQKTHPDAFNAWMKGNDHR